MNKPIIEINHLSKKYQIGETQSYYALRDTLADLMKNPFKKKSSEIKKDEFWALKGINFTVNQGEVVGIIGRNGAGKSTLLKILSQITPPTEGEVILRGRVGSLLEVGTGFHPELTGRENIFLNGAILGMKRTEVKKKFDEIVDFAGVEKFLDMPMKRYSSGMYMRLAFAVAAHLETEILIVDEVLAVGDAEFQKKCLGKMGDVAKEGRTVLFVSHNMTMIQNLCKRSALLNKGRIFFYGSTHDAISKYQKNHRSSKIKFTSGPLKWISAKQDGDDILISAEYIMEGLDSGIPCLGYAINDNLGQTICSSNPLVDGHKYSYEYTCSGRIEAIISQPKLMDGIYMVSIWFGDGAMDYVSLQNCISLDISNMKFRHMGDRDLGIVHPTTKWVYKKI